MPVLIDTPPPGADRADRVGLLRTMLLIRRFEQTLEAMSEQRRLKGTAHSSVGQEAIAAGACAALRPDDFVLSHHRGHGHCLAKGASPARMMAELLGRADGLCGGHGGSMHVADLELGILGANGIVGAGLGLGLGAALAAKLEGGTRVGIAFFGDGAANEGLFHEAMNLAAIWRLPLVFLCENNGYALSTPWRDATAGSGIAARAGAYGMPGARIDGNDVEAVRRTVAEAAERARAGDGPTLIEAVTWRWGDHNMRPGWPRYRTDEEEARGRRGDPIRRWTEQLLDIGALDRDGLDRLEREVDAAITAAVAAAEASPEPDPAAMAGAVLASLPRPSTAPPPGERRLTYVEAINEALAQQMARDGRILVLGEDVARIGGIYGVTRGLLEAHGDARVMDTPISEQAIAGTAVGAALAGWRPVVEIQIFDFVTLMMDMIVNQAAKLRFMLGGRPAVPVVFRGPQGGGVRLAAQHSQSLEAWFAHVPGLVVLAPSTPYDAKGLMAAALQGDNPCIFLEHKKLYLGDAAPVPEAPYALPVGKADIKREGGDLTIIATLAMVEPALKAAEVLARDGISAEVIDPRTLRPLDMDCFVTSVKKTGRCLVVHEAWRTGGLGAEIAAEIGERAFDWLDAPVTRLGGMEVPMPFSPVLERAAIPGCPDIVNAARKLVSGAA